MAHQIESFVTANVPAWHQLGTRSAPCLAALIVPPGTRRTNDH